MSSHYQVDDSALPKYIRTVQHLLNSEPPSQILLILGWPLIQHHMKNVVHEHPAYLVDHKAKLIHRRKPEAQM
jgi:hypothetical protein